MKFCNSKSYKHIDFVNDLLLRKKNVYLFIRPFKNMDQILCNQFILNVKIYLIMNMLDIFLFLTDLFKKNESSTILEVLKFKVLEINKEVTLG